MKALVYDRYGPPDVLGLRDVDRPTVTDDSVLIQVHAASVNRSDWETLTGRPAYARMAGPLRPRYRILGSDVAGRIEAVGARVSRFRPGDEVFGDTLGHGMGAFAEYVGVPEDAPLLHKPAALAFDDAAALPQAAVLALQGLRYRRPTRAGDRVLIVGAGGGGGTFAVQLAHGLGAEVVAVDRAPKLTRLRSLGAAEVIDHEREDPTARRGAFDRILDFVGAQPLLQHRRALRPGGVYAVVGGPVRRLLQAGVLGSALSWAGDRALGVLIARPDTDDLSHLAGMVVAGTLQPIIHRRFALAETPDALRLLGAGEITGKASVIVRP